VKAKFKGVSLHENGAAKLLTPIQERRMREELHLAHNRIGFDGFRMFWFAMEDNLSFFECSKLNFSTMEESSCQKLPGGWRTTEEQIPSKSTL